MAFCGFRVSCSYLLIPFNSLDVRHERPDRKSSFRLGAVGLTYFVFKKNKHEIHETLGIPQEIVHFFINQTQDITLIIHTSPGKGPPSRRRAVCILTTAITGWWLADGEFMECFTHLFHNIIRPGNLSYLTLLPALATTLQPYHQRRRRQHATP